MDSLNAAEVILQQAGEPLHYKEITKRILAQELWQTQGKTPDATVNARFAVDINRFGDRSRFIRTELGIFALRKWGLEEYVLEDKSKKPAPAPKRDPKYSFTDAAELVLENYAEKRPMHYREIADRILELDLVNTQSKTPEATVNARLATNILKNGQRSSFIRTGPGIFALRKWGLEEYIPGKKTTQAESDRPRSTQHADEKYSFTDAAELVLENYAEKRPMHYREITDRILELDLVNTQGKTPEATLYAMVLAEIKRQTNRGETPRFVKYGQGIFGLRKWMGEGLAYQIERHNLRAQTKLLAHIRKMDAKEFEQLIGRLLAKMGFEEIDVTQYVGDGGIDVRGTLVVGGVIETKMAVQVKRYKKGNNVSSPVVQQVRGSLGAHEQGMIITTSNFSKGAVKEAARADAVPVALVNGEQLVELMIEHQLLVKRVPYELINLDVGEEEE